MYLHIEKPQLASQLKDKNLKIHSGSTKKVWWVGKCGHEWEAAVSSRVRGSGCPYCTGQKVLKGFNDLSTTQPDLAAQWSTRNAISHEEVTQGSSKKVWWVCAEGHEWEARVSDRFSGTGCPKCRVKSILDVRAEILSEWSEKNNIDIKDVSYGSNKKYLWVCEKGHEWEASAKRRSKGSDCPKCNILEPISESQPWITKYTCDDLNLISSGSAQKINLVCDKGHTRCVPAYSVKNILPGCSICRNSNSSYVEKDIISKITSKFKIETQKIIFYGENNKKRIIVDALISEFIVLEYDGAYWHNDKIAADMFKTKVLLDKGYSVLRIREVPLPFIDIKEENLIQLEYVVNTTSIDIIKNALVSLGA